MREYSSRYPLSIILCVLLDIISIAVFINAMAFNQLPILYGVFYTLLCVTIIDMAICPYAGKIMINAGELKVKYFFPWRSGITIDLFEITRIETSPHFYRFFSGIYITTQNGIVKKINLQSDYKSGRGIKILESELYKIKKIKPPVDQQYW